MADFIDHVNQAKHNSACARALLITSVYRDWAITAAFYSAVHLAEAGFTIFPDIRHTENASPTGMEKHAFRKKKVLDKFGRDCFKRYRDLHEASNNVRYLAKSNIGSALSYYSDDNAKDFIETDLPLIKQEIEKITGLSLS